MLNLTGKYFVNKVGSGCGLIKNYLLAKHGVPANQESCIYKTLFVFYHYKNKSVNTLMMPPMRKMVLVLDGGNKKPRKLLTPNRLFSLTSRINVYSTRSPNSRTKVCQPHNRMELMYVSKIENERLRPFASFLHGAEWHEKKN